MQNAALIRSQVEVCRHCGQDVATLAQSHFGSYCCAGCKAVAELLEKNNLQAFYDFEKSPLIGQPTGSKPGFKYLDSPEFEQEFHGRTMRFFVAGLDCTACVWLIDRIPSVCSSIDEIRTDFPASIVEIRLAPGAKFSEAAADLAAFGLNPKPILFEEQGSSLIDKESKGSLSRVAVAGFCSGNIMLLSISIYAGAAGPLREVFEWTMAGLFLPILIFSASSLYRNTLQSLKLKRVHIDVPITLAVCAGAGVSFYHLFSGGSELYFDSLAMLVFLLLGSRHLLKSLQQNQTFRFPLLNYVFSVPAIVQGGVTVSALSLRAGDEIFLAALDPVPADSKVVEGEAWISSASLTGESQPQKVGAGDHIFAGTQVVSGKLRASVLVSARESRLFQLLQSIDNRHLLKNPLNSHVELWAQRFLYTVLFISVCTLIFFGLRGSFEIGVYRALTVMIVTCPCVFAMAIPWTLNLAIRNAANRGILVGNPDLFERLATADEVVFDKTGTLTHGFLEVRLCEVVVPNAKLFDIAHTLESASSHPAAKAIVRWIETNEEFGAARVSDLRHIESGGVEGRFGGVLWRISPISSSDRLTVGLFSGPLLIARFELGDLLRADSEEAVRRIRRMGLQVSILSGDQNTIADKTGEQLQIREVHGTKTPEDKLKFIRQKSKAIFVGDGNNDAPAMAASFASIAVQGGLEASLKASDAYLARPGVLPVVELIELSKHTLRVTYANLAFTAIYNSIGLALALTGHITALWAAILMPASSLTVTLHSLYRMKRRGPWKS
ncbi:MAG: heavy metal translocating P-type ATPase metal-binding domain-containing protein [Bdellovibrionia bacterium]